MHDKSYNSVLKCFYENHNSVKLCSLANYLRNWSRRQTIENTLYHSTITCLWYHYILIIHIVHYVGQELKSHVGCVAISMTILGFEHTSHKLIETFQTMPRFCCCRFCGCHKLSQVMSVPASNKTLRNIRQLSLCSTIEFPPS